MLSSEPLRSWAGNDATLQSDEGDTCVVTYTDSSGYYTYSYAIDTRRWLIFSMRKTAYGYDHFNASYSYSYEQGGAPVLTRISFYGDTTLSLGGYRFFNIEINSGLSDTLFEVPARVSRNGPLQARFADDAVLGSQAVGFDLMGRSLMRAGRGGVDAILVEVDAAGTSVRLRRLGSRCRRPGW